MTNGQDRLKYFRLEARELIDGLQAGLLRWEREGPSPELEERLRRQAHTLKGAARVVGLGAIAGRAHGLEDELEALMAGASLAGCLAALDALAAALNDVLGTPTPALSAEATVSAPPGAEAGFSAGRIEAAALEPLWEASLEAGAQLDALRGLPAELGSLEHLAAGLPGGESLREGLEQLRHRLEGGLDRAAGELHEVREQVRHFRWVPASVVVPALERTCRDAAGALGRRVAFTVAGEETRLDGAVLAGVREALMHVVTNAVTHGLETPHVRQAAGKPEAGQVHVRIERRGGRIAFVCQDDGPGIDPEAVRAAAVQRGLLSAPAAHALSAEAAMQLIFTGGLSTQGAVTSLAGRGVGLDVVRALAERLKGDVRAESTPGVGTTIELVVPLTLSSIVALTFEAGGRRASVPLDAVTAAMRIAPADLVTAGGSAKVLTEAGELPFVSLTRLLGGDGGLSPTRPWSAVVVRTPGGPIALGADRLVGSAEVVVNPFPALLGPLPLYLGAWFDGEGHPVPMLDPRGLTPQPAPMAAATSRPRPLLVVDDSLTTRMLEQSILEAAGYEVDLAASAEEGLAMAKQRAYGLFLVDVDMPGMDGFGFLAAIRSDRDLQAVPAVLVTSRDAPADRRRGLEAGARAYIVKGEFDQGHFLETVRGLLT